MSDEVSASGPLYRPSHDDEQGMDPGTTRILIIMGLGGLLILAGIAIYSLLGHGHSGPVPIVEADTKPVRVRPENAGGMAVAVQEKAADPNQSQLAPAPEEPRPLVRPSHRDGVPAAALLQPRPRSITVQLGATKTEAEARTAWDRLAKRMPELMGAHRPLFQAPGETGGRGWSLRTGGFADAARAKNFCDQVRSKGGTCAVVES